MRHPLAIPQRSHRSQDVRRKRPTEQVLRELLAIARVPDLFEIGGMRGIDQSVLCLAQEKWIVDSEWLVEKRQQQQARQKDGGRCQAQIHARGLTSSTN